LLGELGLELGAPLLELRRARRQAARLLAGAASADPLLLDGALERREELPVLAALLLLLAELRLEVVRRLLRLHELGLELGLCLAELGLELELVAASPLELVAEDGEVLRLLLDELGGLRLLAVDRREPLR